MQAYVGKLGIYKNFKTIDEMKELIVKVVLKNGLNIKRIKRKSDTFMGCFNKSYRTINFEVMTDEKLPTGAYFKWDWDFSIVD